ncbi:hypothetical protein GSI_11596 [Ganoderma sinense ZZ0214-1]|uniref:Uncharacterized protein n=1 Tax=Ganoderma sinense ZZ0214-1 TaxID=1077348 RepID=A0A2G8RWF2_9APHY|nr:hypothetical protein GSI_11596 [Ganoderma sinense ZZ0214-1]
MPCDSSEHFFTNVPCFAASSILPPKSSSRLNPLLRCVYRLPSRSVSLVEMKAPRFEKTHIKATQSFADKTLNYAKPLSAGTSVAPSIYDKGGAAAVETEILDVPPDGGNGWVVLFGCMIFSAAAFPDGVWGFTEEYLKCNVFMDASDSVISTLGSIGGMFMTLLSVVPGKLEADQYMLACALATELWHFFLIMFVASVHRAPHHDAQLLILNLPPTPRHPNPQVYGSGRLAGSFGLLLLFNLPGNSAGAPLGGAVSVYSGSLQIFGGLVLLYARFKREPKMFSSIDAVSYHRALQSRWVGLVPGTAGIRGPRHYYASDVVQALL